MSYDSLLRPRIKIQKICWESFINKITKFLKNSFAKANWAFKKKIWLSYTNLNRITQFFNRVHWKKINWKIIRNW